MTVRKIIAAFVLLDFAALNAYALYSSGLSGFVDFLTGLGPWGMVITADLVIALTMVVVWMWRDARDRGRNPLGYTLLTVASGSIGPLLYLVAGESEATEPRDESSHAMSAA